MITTIKSFFDRQKCDLSDKPNEDDERKKARERARILNVSLNEDDTDIFEEEIESTRCAGILYSCLQNLEKKKTRLLTFLPQRE